MVTRTYVRDDLYPICSIMQPASLYGSTMHVATLPLSLGLSPTVSRYLDNFFFLLSVSARLKKKMDVYLWMWMECTLLTENNNVPITFWRSVIHKKIHIHRIILPCRVCIKVGTKFQFLVKAILKEKGCTLAWLHHRCQGVCWAFQPFRKFREIFLTTYYDAN